MRPETHREKNEFVISRTFDAPRQKLWDAFTLEQHLKFWWGPRGFAVVHSKMDLRRGGTYLYCLRSPGGEDIWGKWVFREIHAPERLVFISSFSDERGGVTRHPMSPAWPLEMLSTITFAEPNGRSSVAVKWEPFNPADEERRAFEEGRESMHQGWTGTLDQLHAYLKKVS